MGDLLGVTTVWVRLLERCAELEDGDGYVVLISAAFTGESVAYGPHLGAGAGLAATLDADRCRRELDAQGLGDVVVSVVRLHRS